jgi:stress-induced-phosphoprotein 1
MAACYEKLQQYVNMVDAAKSCIEVDKSFIKGYFRCAVGQKHLGLYEECMKTLESGLAISSSNADLRQMKKEIDEVMRNEQVVEYCQQAETLYQSNDIVNAYKTLQLATQLDCGYKEIERCSKAIYPAYEKYEKYEKQRKQLSGYELNKERGDDMYRNANFEGATVEYTKCIDGLTASGKGDSETALKAYNNRAACYQQMSNFDRVIADCSVVLEVEPTNVKALIRRAQALEGVKRYRSALQDVETVLAMIATTVGKTSLDVCKGMQRRLQRTVDQLKNMGTTDVSLREYVIYETK